ncbi:hypothetical protein E1263_37575 [Kribbella antibiotica]|uniref:Uncharacterized protein n=1 Tax=Kribbella antibiotica TaxID=190195 RepID=A0A4R4YLQ7_9ACTN|nr:hypothetical protein [Kribbella antibiotica]TDD45945.1 hypothetical protein E1263_37575 [Kribbella antibiotica]
MEILVAYAFHRPDSAARAAEGAARVQAYYADAAKLAGHDGSTNGLHLWGPSAHWEQRGTVRVASLHAPVDYEVVEAVRRTPEAFTDLAPPLTMVVLDDDRLELFTDSAGLGQLFQVRLPDGWVWSNRPVAALLFAGVAATASPRGWAFAAACGWFMGDSTPYEGVLAVPGATHIVADGKRQTTTRIEPSTLWLTDAIEEPADYVHPISPLPEALPEPTGLIDRALARHRLSEGLPRDPWSHVAYGYYYPADLPKADALPLHAKLQVFGRHLETALVPATGPSEAARTAVAIQIEHVLRDAVRGGIEDAKMLDYFYLVERLRRGSAPDTPQPQLTPRHIRAALSGAAPKEVVTQPVRRVSRPKRLGDSAERELIDQLLLSVEGFDAAALSTLWAASVAGASSAAAEATLKQALRRATFDLYLAEVNEHLPELVRPMTAPPPALPTQPPTAKPRRSRLVRAFARKQAQ